MWQRCAPAAQYVYNLGAPADATDFLHRAGRAGRIGATVPGTTVTLVSIWSLD